MLGSVMNENNDDSNTAMPAKKLSQPPRNRMDVRTDMRAILMYSARKNIANPIPEYSTWKPATISASPSARSKGCRFVSAIPEIK
tara:strand:+ start:235 stop:489 length:255 start_codon:yes stop_codon:yes gene_type:complete